MRFIPLLFFGAALSFAFYQAGAWSHMMWEDRRRRERSRQAMEDYLDGASGVSLCRMRAKV